MDKHGKQALIIVSALVLIVFFLVVILSCTKEQQDDIPELIEEVAVDVTEELLDEVIEHYTDIDPNFDFNGNDNTKDK